MSNLDAWRGLFAGKRPPEGFVALGASGMQSAQDAWRLAPALATGTVQAYCDSIVLACHEVLPDLLGMAAGTHHKYTGPRHPFKAMLHLTSQG